ncbi:hypothetical protein K456DRAFT_1697348 [Colletotrichum gloeosporioides 23]|nr:hypothetical protein K456DRAFT_1697348 [Colletotrichum gloeosporioides 23]
MVSRVWLRLGVGLVWSLGLVALAASSKRVLFDPSFVVPICDAFGHLGFAVCSHSGWLCESMKVVDRLPAPSTYCGAFLVNFSRNPPRLATIYLPSNK